MSVNKIVKGSCKGFYYNLNKYKRIPKQRNNRNMPYSQQDEIILDKINKLVSSHFIVWIWYISIVFSLKGV